MLYWPLLLLTTTSLPTLLSQSCTDVYPQLSCGLNYNTESSCISAGCCWDTDACYAPTVSGYTYIETFTDSGRTYANLTLKNPSNMLNSTDFKTLALEIIEETNYRMHIRIVPYEEKYWEIPEKILPRPGGIFNESTSTYPGILHMETYISSDPFSLSIIRQQGGVDPIYQDTILDLTNQLVYQSQYIQFILTTPYDVSETYGFGESTRSTQRMEENTTYTLWNTDIASAIFGVSLYGSHPFFIQVKSNGQASGVLFLNSNAMQLTHTKSSTLGGRVGIQSTGGVLDLYIFAGPTPELVVMQYLEVVGKPALVPFWSLGFHNCRWGYPDIGYVEDVVANYSAASIPLETQWLDIDYMDSYLDFTLDPTTYPQARMTAFVDSLHTNNQRFVPIVDPGIYVREPSYDAFKEGMERNVFVMDMTGSTPYLGQVWPGPTYFPDWFAENTSSWWSDQIAKFRDLVEFDGIWIDMNEVANFCNLGGKAQVCVLNASDPCPDNSCCLICSTPEPNNTYDFPPFVPHVAMGSLGGKTMSMNSYHAGGVLEYNAHSLYGFMESIATREALLRNTDKRPFLLSRSTFLGSGVYTAHWTGDNAATWADLSASIITMNNMALFGIPMVGADICGFFEDTTEELCARWIEVGAFSPFSRDHNDLYSAPQELYRWDTVAEASRNVLSLRYRLLPHLYTLMYMAHAHGRTVHNALWMHFPRDPITLSQADGQYMWGASILFTPVLTEGATSVTGYFPKGMWYSLFSPYDVIDSSYEGQFVTIDTPLTSTNAHLRGGHIVPTQSSGMTTTDVQQSPFTLLVALDKQGSHAVGGLFLDDGEQVNLSTYSLVEYIYRESKLESIAINDSYILPSAQLNSVELWGVDVPDAYTSCSAELVTDVGAVVPAASVELQVLSGYKKVIISFDSAVVSSGTVNVASSYTLSWSCVQPGVETKKSSEDDDGWDSLPEYAQGLIIVALCVVFLVVVGVIVYLVKCSGSRKDTELLGAENSRSI